MTEAFKKRRLAVSDLVNPREFMAFWGLEAHEASRITPSNSATILKNIAVSMNIPDETAAELEEVCGKKSLFCGTEPRKKDSLYRLDEQPPDVNLACVKHQLESNRKREKSVSFRNVLRTHLKYNFQDSVLGVVPEGSISRDIEPEHKVPEPNVILTVEITRCLPFGAHSQTHRERDVFLVLGSQSLTDLRDKIKCSSDNVIPGDYSSLPDVDPRTLQKTGEMYKSSFFFIENVFFNDFRQPDNKDYSKNILAWAKDHKPDVNYTTADMSKYKFFDLNIRLGHHYLFGHQGDCEHSVLFSDLRLFSASDYQDRRLYPVLSITRPKTRVVCQACYTLSAKWSVSNSPLIPCEPTLMCDSCYKTLMYTKEGKKTSDFKAYHFVA